MCRLYENVSCIAISYFITLIIATISWLFLAYGSKILCTCSGCIVEQPDVDGDYLCMDAQGNSHGIVLLALWNTILIVIGVTSSMTWLILCIVFPTTICSVGGGNYGTYVRVA
jgi:hypothetical protein